MGFTTMESMEPWIAVTTIQYLGILDMSMEYQDDNSHLQLASIDVQTRHQPLADCGKDRTAETVKISYYQAKNTNLYCESCLLPR